MPRLKRVRKPTEIGRSTSFYLRVGTIERAEQVAIEGKYDSLSAYVEETLRRDLDTRDAQRAVTAA
jgi:hypothetical protein